MSLETVMKKEAALLVPTYDRYQVLLRKGKGVYVYDDSGKKYLDFLSGIGVNALGYGHATISKVMARQANLLVHSSNLFFHEYQGALAEKLTRLGGMDRAFFCNSGTEAWECALKLARAHARSRRATIGNGNGHKPAWRVLAMENSFHGRTLGALSTTGQAKYRDPFAPLMPGVEFVRYNDVDDLKKKFDASVCAIGLEIVQGEGGIQFIDKQFLQAARSLANKYHALLIVDEIQSGLGRTGKMFAYQHFGITPDVVTIAKPLAAGLPLGAVLTREAVSRSFHPGMHGTTFGGGPLACAVAIAFLETLEREKLVEHVGEMGDYLREQLEALKEKHSVIQDVRVLGLMVGVELNSADLAKAAVKKMMEGGVIINRTHDVVLRFLPPYVIGKAHVDEVIEKLDSVLEEQQKTQTKAHAGARRSVAN
jgi:acetylornithine aminotransferase/acetylornithine/N-succinyldiaminopimelate aminotransferase